MKGELKGHGTRKLLGKLNNEMKVAILRILNKAIILDEVPEDSEVCEEEDEGKAGEGE